MTLLSIKTQLLSHFLENDTFQEGDFEKIKVAKNLEKFKNNLIRKSLKDLEDSKIVKSLIADTSVDEADIKSDAWILELPLAAHGQQIYVSLPLAGAISETINTFMEANKLDGDKSNPLSLSERDIAVLLGIINELLEGQDDNEEKDEE
jgi:hypothetical protein